MVGGLGGQVLVRKAVPMCLTLGIQAIFGSGPIASSYRATMVSGGQCVDSIGPPLDRGCFCHK